MLFRSLEEQDNSAEAISASNTNIEGQVGENNTAKEKKEKVDPSQLAEIDFENVTHDFGTVQEGEVVKYPFKFKNTGDKKRSKSMASLSRTLARSNEVKLDIDYKKKEFSY